jgi:hypothetical protein
MTKLKLFVEQWTNNFRELSAKIQELEQQVQMQQQQQHSFLQQSAAIKNLENVTQKSWRNSSLGTQTYLVDQYISLILGFFSLFWRGFFEVV